MGEQGRVHGRADGGARRRSDPQRARLIRRVRDSGVAVVLISHNMPEVIEVADRVEVLRLGRARRALRHRGHRDGGPRGGDDRRPAPRGGVDDRRARARRGAGPSPTRAAGERLATGSTTWIILILVGMIVCSRCSSRTRSRPSSNARNIATNASILLVIAVGMTFVIITAGIDLSVGVGARVLRRHRRQGDAGDRRRQRRRVSSAWSWRSAGASAGASSTACCRQGARAPADRHARDARDGARPRRRSSPAASTSAMFRRSS